jgi:hypothetical protein
MKKAVIGIIPTEGHAEALVADLQRAGFDPRDISVLYPDRRGTRELAHVQGTKAPEGAVTGVGAGGALGGTLGLLIGVGFFAIPGLGPFIAAGPIVAMMAGAAAGAAFGGVAGALVGLGIPEIEAKVYEGHLRDGNILVAVHSERPEYRERAKQHFRAHGASDVGTVTEAQVTSRR